MRNLSFNLNSDSYVFVWQSFIWVKQNKKKLSKTNTTKFMYVEALS